MSPASSRSTEADGSTSACHRNPRLYSLRVHTSSKVAPPRETFLSSLPRRRVHRLALVLSAHLLCVSPPSIQFPCRKSMRDSSFNWNAPGAFSQALWSALAGKHQGRRHGQASGSAPRSSIRVGATVKHQGRRHGQASRVGVLTPCSNVSLCSFDSLVRVDEVQTDMG